MLARRPAAACEPAAETVRQQLGRLGLGRRSIWMRGGTSRTYSLMAAARAVSTIEPVRRGPTYSVTGFSEICQSLPSKIEMWSVFIGE